jgi:hypothetical protein
VLTRSLSAASLTSEPAGTGVTTLAETDMAAAVCDGKQMGAPLCSARAGCAEGASVC